MGHTGLDVSVLGFGSWVSFGSVLGEETLMIKRAFEAGINFFDNAEVYAHGKSEEIMGQALIDLDIPRTDVVVSTRGWPSTGAPRSGRWSR